MVKRDLNSSKLSVAQRSTFSCGDFVLAMDSNEFNVIILGTGLVESILAAALAKVGYSVLQLDEAPHYGDHSASLSLTELIEWSSRHKAHSNLHLNSDDPNVAIMLELSSRFSLSLAPTLLTSTGAGIEAMIRSKVSAYLNFGLLAGIALVSIPHKDADEKETIRIERVPSSKADVFNHSQMSLIEKRRLTKLLLFAAGDAVFEDSPLLSGPTTTFEECLMASFSLSPSITQSLAYALGLCTDSSDLALPSFHRLRKFIQSSGRYGGSSPFLVGHYGGAGDLVGAFSRVCAVFGGGQILGRPILPVEMIDSDSADSILAVPALVASLDSSDANTESTKSTLTKRRRIVVPVLLDPLPAPPTRFTADWIVSSQSHTRFLSSVATMSADRNAIVYSVNAIAILPIRIPFPPSKSSSSTDSTDDASADGIRKEEEVPIPIEDGPDSTLFIFPPRALSERLGTATALQVANGTFACPDGYYVIYLSAPLLSPSSAFDSAESLLSPYLSALFSHTSSTPITPLLILYHSITSSLSPTCLPPNILVTSSLPSLGSTPALVNTIDESVMEAEKLFWQIVDGNGGEREIGIEFFAKEIVVNDDE